MIFIREKLTHFHKASSQEVFPGQYLNGWEVANLLVIIEFEEVLGVNVIVSPHYIPFL